MRFSFAPLALMVGSTLLSMCSGVLAWSETDREIFRLRQDLIEIEGPDATFYSFLGTHPSASLDEINKAYRKASVRLHPDKQKPKLRKGQTKITPGQRRAFQKRAQESYARLNLIIAILRGPARDRYDYFLKNGFPMWKGTGYYYSRYRPGVGSVLLGLFIFVGGGVHYAVLWMTAKQHRKFMEDRIREAKVLAWGDGGFAGAAKPKRVTLENGKQCLVDGSGDVFLLDYTEDGQQVELFLDVEEIEGPKISNTALVRLPKWIFNVTIGRVLGGGKKKADDNEEEEEDEGESEGEAVAGDKKKAAKKAPGAPKKLDREGNLPRRRVKANRVPLPAKKKEEEKKE